MNRDNQFVINSFDPNELVELLRTVVKEELQVVKAREEDQFISPADTCKMFVPSITKATLTSWTKKGLLQEIRFGGRVYYKKSEIMEKGLKLKKYQSIYDQIR